MDKPRVVFPYTEAGFGHIMPLNSIADEFERLYGDKVEIIRTHFFQESGNEKLRKFEEHLTNEVVHHNKHSSYGYYATWNMEFWGIRLSSWATMTFLVMGSKKQGYKHMKELQADLVVCTHWAPNYYARHVKPRPLTVMYCTDVEVNELFSYPCDMVMTSTAYGYEKALKKYGKRFNSRNLKQVPNAIRKEAFEAVKKDKREQRIKFGLDPDKFTVLVAEGGYGIGKMEKICEIILERDLPINLIAVCGKNEQLHEKFSAMKSKGNTVFLPLGLVDDIFDYMVCADLFCGKGSSILFEVTFMGIPQIVTKYATLIERSISEYYINEVGSAIKIFNPEEVVDKIVELVANPQVLEPYRQAALSQREGYGSEKIARYIFGLLCTKFPELKDGTELYD